MIQQREMLDCCFFWSDGGPHLIQGCSIHINIEEQFSTKIESKVNKNTRRATKAATCLSSVIKYQRDKESIKTILQFKQAQQHDVLEMGIM